MDMRVLVSGFVVLAMVAAGCSGDDDDAAPPPPTTAVSAATASSTTALAPSVTEAATTSTSVQEMEVSTTTAPPAEVIEGAFTFADDDLCEWVSEAKVAEFVAAEFEWDGTATVEGANWGDPDSCQWKLTSIAGDVGDVSAANAGKAWKDYSMNDHEYAEMEVVAHGEVDFDEDSAGMIRFEDGAVSGYPSLSDGVTVLASGWGYYTFWVPPTDEYVNLSMRFGVEDAIDTADSEARFFGVADRFVQELGWLG